MKKFFKMLGPGLLYAGAAVGVSHLVQSTRAGALYNYDLVLIVIIANILKYPFFEFGIRYANTTGKNLAHGYAEVGKWAVAAFTLISMGSMFIIMAAVTVVTVSLMAFILNITINVSLLSAALLLVSAIIILLGRYSVLDKTIKIVIVVLSASTIVAVFSALGIDKTIDPDSIMHFQWTRKTDIFFLIAFVGWMPAPLDVTVWASLWSIEKSKQLDFKPNLKDALREFRFGYFGTAVLAIGFLMLGALLMWGTGETLSPKGAKFAEQLISLYTKSIGKWAFWFISIAALTTMFSTTITALDAFPRALKAGFSELMPETKILSSTALWVFLLAAGTMFVIIFLMSSMGQMVNFATTLSFVTAPLLAWLNYKAVTNPKLPKEAMPGKFLKVLSWLGMAFFVVFTLLFFYFKFV